MALDSKDLTLHSPLPLTFLSTRCDFGHRMNSGAAMKLKNGIKEHEVGNRNCPGIPLRNWARQSRLQQIALTRRAGAYSMRKLQAL
jgi:hypothetical protein